MKLVTAPLLLLALLAFPVDDDETDSPWVPAPLRPQYFAVWVEDVERSVAWYAEAFGLEEALSSEAEDGAWQIVSLRNESLFVEIVRDARAQPVEFARGFGKVGFFVSDIEATARRVERATGTRPRVLDFEPLGVRLLQLRDPDGNILQIHQDRG